MHRSCTQFLLALAWLTPFACLACKPYDAALLANHASLKDGSGGGGAQAGAGIAGGGAGAGTCAAAELCNQQDDDCDGKTDEDTLSICQSIILNAETDCVPLGKSATCLFVACLHGYEDCDGNPANGCEPYCACHECDDGGANDGGADLDAN
jgi:hypothetical protein